jgi:hypothetical protein
MKENRLPKHVLWAVFGLCIAACNAAKAQDVTVEGSVVCAEGGNVSQDRPARYIIVYTDDFPSVSTYTDEAGYFAFKIPFKKLRQLRNGSFSVAFFPVEGEAKINNVLVSQQLLYRRNVKLGEIQLDRSCGQAERTYEQANSVLDSLHLRHYSPSSSSANLVGASSLLGALASLLGFVAAGEPLPKDSTVVQSLIPTSVSPKHSLDGMFLQHAFTEWSQNIGFNFTPTRNTNDLVFWNPSALTWLANNQVSLTTDYISFARGSVAVPINETIGIGSGIIYAHQDENRTAIADFKSATSTFGTTEWLYDLAIVMRVDDNMSVGVSAKCFRQLTEAPSFITKTSIYRKDTLYDAYYSLKSVERELSKFDFDLSATYQPSEHLLIGMNVMNVANTKLHSDDNGYVDQRAFGLGSSFFVDRLMIGTEAVIRQGDTPEFSLGMSYLLFDKTALAAGFSSANRTAMASFAYQGLSVSYSSSNQRGSSFLVGGRIEF